MSSKRTDRPLSDKERRVAEVLRGFTRPASAYDLIAKLKDDGLSAPPTVYRALNRLIEKGLAHRLESVNAFIACAHDHNHGTEACSNPGHGVSAIFAVCSACGAVTEFEDQTVTDRLTKWAASNAFDLTGMTLELRGQCKTCREADGE